MNGIAPWLSVADATKAVEFYQAAFGAVELERLGDQVARLAVGEADFWVQRDDESNPGALGGASPVHMILTVDDPDSVFAQAIRAGATEVNPMRDDYGWRIGKLTDPLGHVWEVGRPLTG